VIELPAGTGTTLGLAGCLGDDDSGNGNGGPDPSELPEVHWLSDYNNEA
jgi:hypothetical protein